MSQNNRVFIASGGTGGHIMPARSLALELAKENYQTWLFGDSKYRGYIKKSDKFKSVIIGASQLEKKPLKLLISSIKISYGIAQSLLFILIYRPKFVVAFGGYATFPMLIAGVLTRAKIILHEQNAHLGKVNRIFAKYATKIALSFSNTTGISDKDHKKTILIGNLVRDEILELHKIPYQIPQKRIEKKQDSAPNNRMGYDIILASDFKKPDGEFDDLFNILIIGGSGGAKIFSEILPKAFFNLSEDIKSRINIVQQCRAEALEQTFKQYEAFNLNVEIKPFFLDMPERIKKAHLVMARSGSSSIFEFCAAKKPMILIPFAKSADNHQEKNARFIEENGAAIVISESDFTINKASETLRNLIDNEEMLQKMSQAAANLTNFNAAENLIKLLK